VAEIAFDGASAPSRYPGAVALASRARPLPPASEKPPDDVDLNPTVQASPHPNAARSLHRGKASLLSMVHLGSLTIARLDCARRAYSRIDSSMNRRESRS
jgi:hypothetical protein